MGQHGGMVHHSIDVVVALLWRDNRLLVGLRPEGKAYPLLWEFPGGKCEPQENHTEALVRECREELGVCVNVGPRAFAPAPVSARDAALKLFFYHASLSHRDAEPKPLVALELRWLLPTELIELPFCPADAALIDALAAGTIAPWC